MKIIKLTKGYEAIVDDEDFEELSKYKWCAANSKYAVSSKVGLMHRFILKPQDYQYVDHINGNGFDNRRENLRLCLPRENAKNKHGSVGGKSQYKGVTLDSRSGKWVARIMSGGLYEFLGSYGSEEEAARMYDAAARYYYDEFSSTNFEGTEKLSVFDIQRKHAKKLRGAFWNKRYNRWEAKFKHNYQSVWLGIFPDEISAAKAYDAKAREVLGSRARVNFPEES